MFQICDGVAQVSSFIPWTPYLQFSDVILRELAIAK